MSSHSKRKRENNSDSSNSDSTSDSDNNCHAQTTMPLAALTLSVKDAAAAVEQLKQTVDQLQQVVNKRQADVDAISTYLVNQPGAKPLLPQSADLTTQLLWQKDWNNDTLLERAEHKLEHTEGKLKDAKSELKDAEGKLERAGKSTKKQPFSREELTSFMEQFIAHSVQTLSTAEPSTYNITKRSDDTGTAQQQLSDLVRRVRNAVTMQQTDPVRSVETPLTMQETDPVRSVETPLTMRETDPVRSVETPFTMQDTKAAVLMSASGVGKTFTALTYPTCEYAVAGMTHLTIYLGFNSDCGLTKAEESFLKDAKMKEDAVATIILGRLVACLAVLGKEGYPERSPNSDVHRIVRKVSCDFLIEKLKKKKKSSHNLETLSTVLQTKAVELLASLQEAKNTPVAVLINVDEAQKFDFIEEKGAPMGARFALRYLRRLQMDVVKRTNGACVPLGFATGINPYYSLPDATDGLNVIIDGPIMERRDFDDLALKLMKMPNDEPRLLSMAVIFYPRVRAFIGCAADNDYIPEVIADRDLCVKLFDAFIRGAPMPRDEIPRWCVNWGRCGIMRDVYIDYCIWERFVSCLDPSAPNKVKKPVKEVKPTENLSCFAEDTFGRIVYAVLYLMFRPPLQGLEEAAAHYRKGKGAALQAALGLRAQDCISTLEYYGIQSNATQNYQPFQHARNHDDAYMTGELSQEFQYWIKCLTGTDASTGACVLFACGGSAPIDFIFVRRSAAGELVMWYADSKSHVGKTSKKERLDEARGIATKALRVHWGILRTCPGISISPHYTVSVMTNVSLTVQEIGDVEQQTRLPVDLSQLTLMKFEHVNEQSENFQTQPNNPHVPGVKVLCPTNFAFEPLTPILYRAVDERAFLKGPAPGVGQHPSNEAPAPTL